MSSKNKVFLWIAYTLPLIMGLGIAALNFIPSWEKKQTYVIFALFLLPGFLYLKRLWIKNYKNRKHIKLLVWFKSVLITIFWGIIFLMVFLVAELSGIDDPEPRELKLHGYTFYIYENPCFPTPDNMCECRAYSSFIYIKNRHLPIMHLIKRVYFYAGNMQLIDNKLIIKAAEDCERDRNKQMEINLE